MNQKISHLYNFPLQENSLETSKLIILDTMSEIELRNQDLTLIKHQLEIRPRFYLTIVFQVFIFCKIEC